MLYLSHIEGMEGWEEDIKADTKWPWEIEKVLDFDRRSIK